MIVTCHCFFHRAKKLRSGAIVRFSDNSSSSWQHLLTIVNSDLYITKRGNNAIGLLLTNKEKQVLLVIHVLI